MVLAAALVSGLATTSGAAGGDTTRVSVDSSGAKANNASSFPKISSDGRFVALESMASNLVEGDTNDLWDIFVHEFEVDTTAPKVVAVRPARGVTGVSTAVNVTATFSEPVYYVKTNFKLYRKGSTTPVDAVFAPVAGTNNKKWVLNPTRSLEAGTIYIAKVLTG